MRALSTQEARTWLKNNSNLHAAMVEKVIEAFDFSHPVYLQEFEPEELLYQFIRNSSHEGLPLLAGSWFCLTGATKRSLAIIDGLSGRELHAYRVARMFTALEGSASALPIQWSWAGGGPGGGTQVYVPAQLVRACMIPSGRCDP